MILRRFMLHIKEQNWFAVGLDVLVVIVGIFLGMQVTDWNEERKESRAEEGYLRALSGDLVEVRENLVIARKIHTQMAVEGLAALDWLDGKIGIEDDRRNITRGILYPFRLPYPQVRLGELGNILDRQIQIPVSDMERRKSIIKMVDKLNSTLEIYGHIIQSIDDAHSHHLTRIALPIFRGEGKELVLERAEYIDFEALREDKVFFLSLQNITARHRTSEYMLDRMIAAIDLYLGELS